MIGEQTRNIWSYSHNGIEFKLITYRQKGGWSCITLDIFGREEVYCSASLIGYSDILAAHDRHEEVEALTRVLKNIRDNLVFNINGALVGMPKESIEDIINSDKLKVRSDRSGGVIGIAHPDEEVFIPKGERWW